MNKQIIIIGAGIAGLTAGIYARSSGFDVTILEQHTIPGGMCTSWRRSGYLFEGAMHWLTGSSDSNGLNEIWREVNALNDTVKVRYDEVFRSIEWEGQILRLYRDLNKLQRHFDELSPEDAETTKQFIATVRAFSKMQMPITDIKGIKTENPRKMDMHTMFKMLSLLPQMGKMNKLSAAEYINQFKHPALRLVLNSIVPEEYNAVSLFFTMATFAIGDGGYPEGGSLAMTKRMADTFTELGGKILYQTKAEKIIVQNGHTVGVRVNAQTMPADAVIITQETLAAAEQLFDIPPTDKWLINLKRDTKPAACTFVSIGVRTPLKETPSFMLAKPIQYGNFTYSILGFNNYYDYPGYAPEGGTALTAFFGGDSYDFWKKAKEEGRYEAEKLALAEQVSKALCLKYPQAEGKIEVIDVATPLTYERYTGSSKGSWMSVFGKGEKNKSCPCTLKNIAGVYFAGHRTLSPGGMPAALVSGRTAAQLVCRQFGMVFKAMKVSK